MIRVVPEMNRRKRMLTDMVDSNVYEQDELVSWRHLAIGTVCRLLTFDG